MEAKKKAVCHVCEQTFELCPVVFDEDSNVSQGEGGGFSLLPEHDSVPGKAVSHIRSSKTGEILKTICAGSFRPPKIAVH